MTAWNNLRSILSTMLLEWAIRAAPAHEKLLLTVMVHEYLEALIAQETKP
jgi:hypothetical protein